MANLAANRTVASCIANGSTNIPLRRSVNKGSSSSPPPPSPTNASVHLMVNGENDMHKWKVRLEDSERKRKNLLAQNEKNIRIYQELEKKYNSLQAKNDELETELFEKNESLTKLTAVSKNLFKEYDMLKNKYDAETGAMDRALNDATHWYRENKILRRKTLLLDNDAVDEGVDEEEGNNDHDLENLRESVKTMSDEIARLQSELNSAKLLEFETSEQNANLTQELEIERKKINKLEEEVAELEKNNNQLLRISKLVQKELHELKASEQNQRDNASRLRKEADDFKKERNILAHQSTVLLQGLNSDHDFDHTLLFEIEDLKRALEDERNKYNLEIATLQEKLEEQEMNSHTEILEERLKLVESELEHALKRAEEAEELVKKELPPLSTLPPTEQPQTTDEVTFSIVPPPPPLPTVPPPPPPPPLVSLVPPVAPIRTKKRSSIPDSADSIPDDPEYSTVSLRRKPTMGVNDDIINQIKSGRFLLKKRKSLSKNERETPKAVNEMLSILGSLRRTTSKSKISLSTKFADVQL